MTHMMPYEIKKEKKAQANFGHYKHINYSRISPHFNNSKLMKTLVHDKITARNTFLV